MRALLPKVLAVVLPVLVLGVGAVGVSRFEGRADPEEAREEKNAGRVMNGRRLNQSVVTQMEQELKRREPEILVLGNSFANTNLDPKVLARELDLPAKRVKVMSVPNSVGPHWYAILKNRVYANGHHPPLVVVVSNLQSTLLVQPYSESSYANYAVQLGDVEPLLDAKVPRTSPLFRQLRQRRGAVRDSALALVRDAAIGLFYRSPTPRRDNERALERVFADDKVDMSRYGNAMPVVEVRGEMPGIDAVPHPSESMLPELGALATANGSRLLFVRSPMAPRTPGAELDLVPEGYERATAEVLDETGHLFADLSGLRMQDALFVNPGHMTEEGSRLFTRVLARVIQDEEAFGGATVPVSWRPSPPVISVQGQIEDADGLAELMGGRWVGPGGTLTVHFDEGWQNPVAAWDLELVMERFGKGPRPTVTVDGQVLTLQGRPGGGERVRLRADRPMPPPTGPWTVEVVVPDGAPAVLVQGLRVGRGGGGRQVIGRVENHRPAQFDLFGELELREDGLTRAVAEVGWDREPPAVPRRRKVTGSPKKPRTGMIEAGDLKSLSDAATLKLTPLGIRCSPLRVLEDGVELARHHEGCADKTRVKGRVCHGPAGKIVFTASDAAPIPGSGRKFTLALDPERDCSGGRWLYPKDRMTVGIGADVLARFREGARSVALTAASADGRPLTAQVTLRADGEVILRDVLQLTGDEPVTRRFSFDRALWPESGQVELVVENPEERFVLISRGVLSAGR